MADALQRLARLEARHLDEEARALGELAAAIAAVQQPIAALRAQRKDEIARKGHDPAEARLLANWLQASRSRERELGAERDHLNRRRADALARLTLRRVELRQLELLMARRSGRAGAAAARAEQRALDDLAGVRHAAKRM